MKETIILLFIFVVAVSNIIRFIMSGKCFGKREHDNRNCHFQLFCGKEPEALTQDDLNHLTEMINKYAEESDEYTG